MPVWHCCVDCQHRAAQRSTSNGQTSERLLWDGHWCLLPHFIYILGILCTLFDYVCTLLLWCRQDYVHFDRRINWGRVRLSNWHSLNRACKWERQDSTPKCLTLEFFTRLAEFKSLGCVVVGPHLLASTFCDGISGIEGEEELGISL